MVVVSMCSAVCLGTAYVTSLPMVLGVPLPLCEDMVRIVFPAAGAAISLLCASRAAAIAFFYGVMRGTGVVQTLDCMGAVTVRVL